MDKAPPRHDREIGSGTNVIQFEELVEGPIRFLDSPQDGLSFVMPHMEHIRGEDYMRRQAAPAPATPVRR